MSIHEPMMHLCRNLAVPADAEAIKHFFQEILLVPNASFEHLVSELRKLSDRVKSSSGDQTAIKYCFETCTPLYEWLHNHETGGSVGQLR
jgi:hypothetical protein